LEDLKHIGTELHKGEYDGGRIKDYEFHQMFIAELKVPLESLVINKEEVEAIKLVTFGEFNKLLKESQSNGHFIPSNKAYYTYILDCISAH
jgi:isopentenyldiphosphate isomerase